MPAGSTRRAATRRGQISAHTPWHLKGHVRVHHKKARHRPVIRKHQLHRSPWGAIKHSRAATPSTRGVGH